MAGLTGQDLLDLATARLGGYGNALDTQTLMSFINEAKDDIWAVLKDLYAEYFVTSTQSSDSSQTNYFGPMSVVSREYNLPSDLEELLFIEVLSSGYEDTRFVRRAMSHPDFQNARREATADQTSTSVSAYLYDIIGKRTFELAQYPEFAFNITIWYVRLLPDLETGDTLDEIILPYSKKIADYAVQKAMLVLQDVGQFEEYRKQWKDEIVQIATSASPRNISDPQFVQDFLG